ncbi:geminin coiled-coil domain-containing protein 1 [Kryptolebias marmoratus]|uniref:geminin coiled-coil domain-containing protein 1 n=1 Tax=Kryptolebias marmoratus TaxID=37003 RepID=UPI000D530452|nr:geminin coiled-coil domain-containing protein 1 [Kryptolebias marmoratus]XP_037830311.1 geminin coiled-coil domain-containing protein 1 [Kryptolebias marmoratus]XP_037830312.1 geminin coiled-coil domain-containing protein 1 [Kryptolebias marmoratus]XP_037830313.1 geminin coiled-coil domain-containing protein 1 [Kryptolebias marmoratus]XP_037830314.1 geminin coiled-coil domain-containing protein 1 [Kryptolebias marmoratus]XP_037830315.1 geminin coiled-coil domain-containing protein 1 [Krypto
METLSPLWVPGLHELCDLSESSNMSSPVCDSQCVFTNSPPAGGMWTQQLSPHLQRNKQLQDALLQREEELARLQEENSKLREFLNSSFVRNLQQKAQNLSADGRRNLKRTLTGPSLLSKHISKRVCRNLTAEFCSESCSEPNLDHWVLRTLGLKDRDTIDTTSESSPEDTFRGPSSSSEWTPGSCFSFPVDPLTPSSVHSCCQRPEPEPGLSQPYDGPDRPTQNCSRTPGDFTAPGLTGPYGSTEALILSPNGSGSFLSHRPETCPIKTLCPVQTQDRTPGQQSSCWSSLPENWTPSGFFSAVSSSTHVPNKSWTGSGVCSPMSPPAGSQPPDPLQVPHRQTDLAFSMSLSPSSSVKTHSFPQGQAFVRRDTGGRWNFTWVPRQEP